MENDNVKELIRSARVRGDSSIRRYNAAVVDQVAAFACFAIGGIGLRDLNVSFQLGLSDLTIGLLAYAWYLIYFALTEWLFSATIGKYLFSLRVRSLSFQPCTLRQSMIRTAMRVIEVNPLLLGALPAILMIKFSQRGQRFGEILSGTIVIPADTSPSLVCIHRQRRSMVNWEQRIVSDPQVCDGKPCVRGTRIMVSVILDNLAEGLSLDEIVAEYPPLTLDDVLAVIAYAATLTREEELVPLR